MNNHDSFEMYEEVEKYHQERKGIFHDSKTFSDFDRSYSTYSSTSREISTPSNSRPASPEEIRNQLLGYPFPQNNPQVVGNTSYPCVTNILSSNLPYYESFVFCRCLVRLSAIGKASEDEYWIRDFKKNRHVPISINNIKVEYSEFLKNCGVRMKKSQIDNDVNYMLNNISTPKDDKYGLMIIGDDEVVFKDCIIDVKKDEKRSLKIETDRIFNRFSFPIEAMSWNTRPPEPVKFIDALKHIFKNDENKIKLFYQVVGLILWTGDMDKRHIFVFQGSSNTWKSRLADLIIRLLGDEDDDREKNVFIGDLTTKSMEEIKFNQRKYRLWYVDETSGKPLDNKLASDLKEMTGGRISSYVSPVSILICTNKAIYQGSPRKYPNSLRNRTIFLPFTNYERNTSAYEYTSENNQDFMKERPAIIYYALQAVNKLLAGEETIENNLDMFNNYIEEDNDGVYNKTGLTQNEQQKSEQIPAKNRLTERNSNQDIYSAIDKLYKIADKPNPEMTPKRIMDDINKLLDRKPIKNAASVGKYLNEILGNQLQSYRNQSTKQKETNGSTIYYNLECKSLPDTDEQATPPSSEDDSRL